MPKFYLQSGNVRTIVSADDAERAALWTIHCTMRQVVPVFEDAELSPTEKQNLTRLEGPRVLGQKMTVSEIGFDSVDAQTLDTFELLTQWHQLMAALVRLSSLSTATSCC